jgi:hypothetical protein
MLQVTVSGGNLYALAALYLQDATAWIQIAQLNGLTDPMLPGTPMTLLIPSFNTQTGGIPPQ